MGRGGKRGSSRGGQARKHTDKGRREDNRVSFDKVPKSNERLERYYNQILGLTENVKSEFWDALKRELPNSFRFTGSKSHALAVQRLLRERYIPQISAITHHDGTLVRPPEPIPWYPDELAWSMTTPKSVVRRFPPFAAFQKYLVSQTSVGNISRQEVVSMIPPLVMDIRPGMTVLDMCAAPGSKAAQLLEIIHTGEEVRMRKSFNQHIQINDRETNPDKDESVYVDVDIDNDDCGRATGLLIANDSDYKRSHMLIHQLKRLSSPNLIVTNHDATIYPSIKLPSSSENPSINIYLKFDRILADVPCSGDGTTRKNVNLWKDWNPGSAIGLHTTQVRILVRALQMLKVGGRVVYSTCSMNPLENEAVVSSAIALSGGLSRVKLLSCDDKLPLLKRKPGLRVWSIMDKSGKIWSSWNEVKDSKEKGENVLGIDKLLPGMFPPASDSPDYQIPFENCMRVYAHLQDTGGFFVAVLEKQTEFKTKFESGKIKTKVTVGHDAGPHITAVSSKVASKSDHEASDQDELIADKTLHDHLDNPCAQKRSLDESNIENETSSPEKRNKVPETIESNPSHEKKIEVLSDLNIIPDELQTNTGIPSQIRQNRNRYGAVEEPFKYLSPEHAEIQVIESFYKLSPRFPRDRFMVRNALGQPAKTIYYTSSLIRDILTENEGHGIKFLHAGVKMFMKQDVQGPEVCKWRIQSEGMHILEGYVGEDRIVYLRNKETFKKLLIEMFPKVANGAWQDLGEIGERVRDIGMGCLVLRIHLSLEDGTRERMVLPLWRSAASLNLMLAKEDRAALLLRMFNYSQALIHHSKEATGTTVEQEHDFKEDPANEAETPNEVMSSFEANDVKNPSKSSTEDDSFFTSGLEHENRKNETDLPTETV